MTDAMEALGSEIDRLDSLAHALQLPMPAQFHVDQLKTALPERVTALKAAFVQVAGENPWA
jgi:hypothetical protein